jgi:hypothetical protein
MRPNLVLITPTTPALLRRYVNGKRCEVARLEAGPNDTIEGIRECVEDFRRNGLPAPDPEAA